jgi:hypothetical protein
VQEARTYLPGNASEQDRVQAICYYPKTEDFYNIILNTRLRSAVTYFLFKISQMMEQMQKCGRLRIETKDETTPSPLSILATQGAQRTQSCASVQ